MASERKERISHSISHCISVLNKQYEQQFALQCKKSKASDNRFRVSELTSLREKL